MNMPKSLDEHARYVEDMVRVSLYFASKWLKPRFPESSISELIEKHTPLLYHGLNYLQPEQKTNEHCLDILQTANEMSDLSPNEFEEKMWAYIAPHALERAELNYPKAVGVAAPASWNCGSLKYDLPSPSFPEGWINFHIANAVGPQSIFDTEDYLPWCFMLLMKETEVRFGSRVLRTGTWLNCREDWLRYFPQEWHDNLQPMSEAPDVPAWHFGFWGQIVTGRGTINPKAVRYVRETGHLRYFCRSSHCSFENMRKHLKENFL